MKIKINEKKALTFKLTNYPLQFARYVKRILIKHSKNVCNGFLWKAICLMLEALVISPEKSTLQKRIKWFFTRINFINILFVLMQTNDMMQCPISNLFSSSSLTHSVFIFPWNMYEIYFLKDDGLQKWMEVLLLWYHSLSCTSPLKTRF